MEYIIRLPQEFAEVYRLASMQLGKSIEETLTETLINYIMSCLH